MGIWVLLALGILVVLWWYHGKIADQEIFPSREAEDLILETESVAADFLEAGELVRLLSRENYLGTISVRLHSRRRGRTGCTVCMYDSGDISLAFSEFRREFPEADLPELEKFVKTYGGCYDSQRGALVYTTLHSAKLTGETRAALEQELTASLAVHPLAEVETLSLIHTKTLAKP